MGYMERAPACLPACQPPCTAAPRRPPSAQPGRRPGAPARLRGEAGALHAQPRGLRAQRAGGGLGGGGARGRLCRRAARGGQLGGVRARGRGQRLLLRQHALQLPAEVRRDHLPRARAGPQRSDLVVDELALAAR